MGAGRRSRCILCCLVSGIGDARGCEDPGVGRDRLVLDRLSGREKLNAGFGRPCATLPISENGDVDLGVGRLKCDIGEWGIDMPLLEDIFRGLENVEPVLELA